MKEAAKKPVYIPAGLYQEIEKVVKGSEQFKSVEDYVIFVLQEVTREDEDSSKRSVTLEEEAEVKKRLKSLGYLD